MELNENAQISISNSFPPITSSSCVLGNKMFLLKHALHSNLIYYTTEELYAVNKTELVVSNNWSQNIQGVRANRYYLLVRDSYSDIAE